MMLNTVYNTVNLNGLCNTEEALSEANYLVRIEMVDGSSQLLQISKEQAIALGIEFSDSPEAPSEVVDVENDSAADTNSIQLKIVPSKTQYNYKVIQPEDLNLRPNLPVPALALPRGRPKKRTPSDHIETKQEPPPKIIKRARTRCGRISRPPVRMEKVFKIVSNEDSRAEQKTSSKPTQTETLIKTTEPPPLIHKKVEKIEPPIPPQPPQPPPKKKRVISAQYRCSTCRKAYLGRNRMAQHLKKHPDHGMNSHFNLDDNEAWECLVETALKAKEGQKGDKFCKEFVTLVKNARILAKYFFKPAKMGKAEYHVDDFLSGLLNLKVGAYRFNENELCKDVSIFSFLEYFDDNFITAEPKQKNETEMGKVELNKTEESVKKNEVSNGENLSGSDFLIKNNITEKSISINDELNKINSINDKINSDFPNHGINLIDKIPEVPIDSNPNPFIQNSIDYLNKIDYTEEKIMRKAEQANIDLHFGSEIIDVIKNVSPKNPPDVKKQLNFPDTEKPINFIEPTFFLYQENKDAKQPNFPDLYIYEQKEKNDFVFVEDKDGKDEGFHEIEKGKKARESKRGENDGLSIYKERGNENVSLLEERVVNKNLSLYEEKVSAKNDFIDLFKEKGVKANKNDFEDLFKGKDMKTNKSDFEDLFKEKELKTNKNDFGDLFKEKGIKINKNDFGDIFKEKNLKANKSDFGDLFKEKDMKANKNDFGDLFESGKNVVLNKNDFGDLFKADKNVKSSKSDFHDLFKGKDMKGSKNNFDDLFEGHKNVKANENNFHNLFVEGDKNTETNKNNFDTLFEEENKSKKNNFDNSFEDKNTYGDLFEEKNKTKKNDYVGLFEEKNKPGGKNNFTNELFSPNKDKTNKNDFTDLLFETHVMGLNLVPSPEKSISKENQTVGNFNLNLLSTPEKPGKDFNMDLLSTPNKDPINVTPKEIINLEPSGIEAVGGFNLNFLAAPSKNSTGKNLESQKEIIDGFLSEKKVDFPEKNGEVEVMDLHKLHLLSDELILPVGESGVAGILDTSTNSDDIMNVDQFVNERFKKLTGTVDEVMSGLDLPHLDCFHFHPS